MKYWIRGGIIGLIIGLIFGLYSYYFNSCHASIGGGFGGCSSVLGQTFAMIEAYIYLPVIYIGNNILPHNLTFLIYSPIIVFTLLGIIIGWIYGKIKNRNRV